MPVDLHPRRRHIHTPGTMAERAADAVVAGMGSWRFVIGQTVVVLLWVVANGYLLARHPFDPYPFILLNLAFSTQAAYASPLILMAGNRTAQKDRRRDDREADEVDLLVAELALLKTINQQQSEILSLLRDHLLPASSSAPVDDHHDDD